MFNFILRRFIVMIPILLAISIISFVIIQLPPGDFVHAYISRMQQQGETVPQETIDALRQRYGLGQPIYVQYYNWIKNIITRFDFGYSFYYTRGVRRLIASRVPLSMLVAGSTMIFTWVVALPIGIYSAVKQYSIGDYVFTLLGFLGLSVPNFMLALILMFISYRYFGFSVGGLFSQEYINAPWSWPKFVNMLQHIWVPIVVIGTAGTASMIRIMRANLLDELHKPYVTTARAKGMKEWKLIFKYPVRVALNPFISTIGWMLPRLFSGATIVAIVLSLPTIGPVLLQALRSQDMYLAGSIVLILSFLTVIGTLISDILLAWLDPRIRYDS